MKKTAFVALLALALVGCRPVVKTQSGTPVNVGTVGLAATAPDGTKLWVYNPPASHPVYFASSGTQRNVTCGKNCSRQERVPTSY